MEDNMREYAARIQKEFDAVIELGHYTTFGDARKAGNVDFSEFGLGSEGDDQDARDLQFQWIESRLLEVAVYKHTLHDEGHTPIVWLLLGCGGPTTRVCIDQWDGVTLHHSWGKDDNGKPCTVWPLVLDADELRSLFVPE